MGIARKKSYNVCSNEWPIPLLRTEVSNGLKSLYNFLSVTDERPSDIMSGIYSASPLNLPIY